MPGILLLIIANSDKYVQKHHAYGIINHNQGEA
jgi:hypothetical protein